MYRCTECGNIFEDGEQKSFCELHREVDSMQYERFDGCPLCGGAYEEVHNCEECGCVLSEDESFCGLCAGCVQDHVTYDTALAYLKSRKIFVEFMMEKVYSSQCPEHYSNDFRRAMEENYRRMVANDKLLNDSILMTKIVKYIMVDDDEYGVADFAEFLKETEVIK